MIPLDAAAARPLAGGPSFALRDRLRRLTWIVAWGLLARWTPPPLAGWRRLVLRLFGAEVGRGARVHGSVAVWWPPHLAIGAGALVGPGARLYNQGRIEIGAHAVVSQRAHLCAGTHDLTDPHFQLVARPIRIGAHAWVAAEAFVGPGAEVGEGAVLAARAALFGAAEPWGVYRGNPARFLKARRLRG